MIHKYFFTSTNRHTSEVVTSIALFALMIIALYFNSIKYLESYTTSDWLINYQGGFIRRGLIVQLVYMTTSSKSSMLWVIFGIQALCVLGTTWLILKIYFSAPKNYNWLIVLLSPAFFFTFTFHDISASLRKELLVFFAMSLLIYSLIGQQLKIGVLRASLIIYFVAVYSHELASLCIPFFIYPLISQLNNPHFNKKLLKKYIVLFSCIAFSGFITSLIFHGNKEVIEKMCQSLFDRGFSIYICSAGSIQFMTNNLKYAIGSLIWELDHQPYVALFLSCQLLALIPFFCSNWLSKCNVKLLSLIGFVFLLPLFITGIDWGRWIHTYIVLLSLCLLFDASQRQIFIRSISKFALILFVAFWTLPAWFYKPSGVLQSYSPYLPHLGILDAIYPIIFPPTLDAKLKSLEQDVEFKKQLAIILQKYRNLIVYPLDKNSEIQNFIARLAKSEKITTNLSPLNAFSSHRAFNLMDDQQIQLINAKNESAFTLKQLDPRSLYAIPSGSNLITKTLLALDPQNDILIDAGIFTLVLPRWNICTDCPKINTPYLIQYDLTELKTKTPSRFLFSHSNAGKNPLLLLGWQPFAEDWGIWSNGNVAIVSLPAPSNNAKQVEVNLRAFITGKEASMPITIQINDGPAIPYNLRSFDNNHLTLPLPPYSPENTFITIRFEIPSPKRPKDFGLGMDDRLIGIGLKSIQYLPNPN